MTAEIGAVDCVAAGGCALTVEECSSTACTALTFWSDDPSAPDEGDFHPWRTSPESRVD